MMQLLSKLNELHDLSSADLRSLIIEAQNNVSTRSQLFDLANKTKTKYYGDTVYLRGLIETSNYCSKTCMYCGLRSANTAVNRYRLAQKTILKSAELGYSLGFRTVVMQSGEDAICDDAFIVDTVRKIKEKCPDTAITLSMGERSENAYTAFKNAGADRYLLRHETANKRLYQKMHPGMSFDNRIACLEAIKSSGLQTGSGFLVGLPEQTVEDYVLDLMLLKRLKPAMVGIGPFIPHPDTPLKNTSGGDAITVLIMIAITRLLLPKALLPATTALNTIDAKSRDLALQVGANVLMPNLSPADVRKKYEIYKNKKNTGLESAEHASHLIENLSHLGLSVDMGRGDHVDWR